MVETGTVMGWKIVEKFIANAGVATADVQVVAQDDGSYIAVITAVAETAEAAAELAAKLTDPSSALVGTLASELGTPGLAPTGTATAAPEGAVYSAPAGVRVGVPSDELSEEDLSAAIIEALRASGITVLGVDIAASIPRDDGSTDAVMRVAVPDDQQAAVDAILTSPEFRGRLRDALDDRVTPSDGSVLTVEGIPPPEASTTVPITLQFAGDGTIPTEAEIAAAVLAALGDTADAAGVSVVGISQAPDGTVSATVRVLAAGVPGDQDTGALVGALSNPSVLGDIASALGTDDVAVRTPPPLRPGLAWTSPATVRLGGISADDVSSDALESAIRAALGDAAVDDIDLDVIQLVPSEDGSEVRLVLAVSVPPATQEAVEELLASAEFRQDLLANLLEPPIPPPPFAEPAPLLATQTSGPILLAFPPGTNLNEADLEAALGRLILPGPVYCVYL